MKRLEEGVDRLHKQEMEFKDRQLADRDARLTALAAEVEDLKAQLKTRPRPRRTAD